MRMNGWMNVCHGKGCFKEIDSERLSCPVCCLPLPCGNPDHYRLLLPLNSGPVLTQSLTIRVHLSLRVFYEAFRKCASRMLIFRTFLLTFFHRFLALVAVQSAWIPPAYAICSLYVQTAPCGHRPSPTKNSSLSPTYTLYFFLIYSLTTARVSHLTGTCIKWEIDSSI